MMGVVFPVINGLTLLEWNLMAMMARKWAEALLHFFEMMEDGMEWDEMAW